MAAGPPARELPTIGESAGIAGWLAIAGAKWTQDGGKRQHFAVEAPNEPPDNRPRGR